MNGLSYFPKWLFTYILSIYTFNLRTVPWPELPILTPLDRGDGAYRQVLLTCSQSHRTSSRPEAAWGSASSDLNTLSTLPRFGSIIEYFFSTRDVMCKDSFFKVWLSSVSWPGKPKRTAVYFLLHQRIPGHHPRHFLIAQEGQEDRQDFQSVGGRASVSQHSQKKQQKYGENYQINHFTIWKFTKQAEQIEKHLFKKNWTLLRREGSVLV